MFRSKIIPATLAGAIALGGATAAFAANGANHNDEQQEAAAVQNAKTSLVQAIAAAEQHTGGQAIDTGVENHDGKVIGYDVKVAKGNTVQKVLVDLDTGEVLKVTAADPEHEEGGEHEDE
ncbi:MAG: PepSY domain-containing protein [Burkholderiales bacterium]